LARRAGTQATLVESNIASARHSVEEGIFRAVRNFHIDCNTVSVTQSKASITDAFSTIVVTICRAGWNNLAGSLQVLGTLNADTGLEGRIVSFVFVAVGDEVGFDTVSIDVSDKSDETLADNSVECLINSTRLTWSKNPEESFLAVAFTISKISIQSAVLIAAAFSIDDWESTAANAASAGVVIVTVQGALVDADAFSIDYLFSVVADTLAVDIGLILPADWFA
jgi:hypothetical protein